MKKIILIAGLLMSFAVVADIDYEGETSNPTPEEIARNRACFEDLSRQGCGDAGEDPEHFRSCMSNVYTSLSQECQSLMTKLYGE